MSKIHKTDCRPPETSRRNRIGTARTNGQARRPDGRTTCSLLIGAADLMELALPFTATPGKVRESREEFASIAIAERVLRLKDEFGFPLPPGMSPVFPFTKGN